jgi:hypothetical protein
MMLGDVSDEAGNTVSSLKTNINEFIYLLISQTQAKFYGIFIFYSR